VKQTTFQNLWPLTLNYIISREARSQKPAQNAVFCGASREFEHMTVVARRREHFRGFLANLFVAELPQKRGCFNAQEFARFLSTGVVSASSLALWHVFSNKVKCLVTVELTSHTYTPMRKTLCFSKAVCQAIHNIYDVWWICTIIDSIVSHGSSWVDL